MGAMTKTKPDTRPTKLGVEVDPAFKKRLEHEAIDADLSLRELVYRRLILSYQVNPGPLSLESIPA